MVELDFWTFTLLALAAYRLTRLVVQDEILSPLRDRVWDRFPPESTRTGYLLTCPWCTGFWVSLLLFAAYTAASAVVIWFCIVLGLAAVTGWLSALEHRL